MNSPRHSNSIEIPAHIISGVREHENAALDEFASILQTPLTNDVASFLGRHDSDVDDVVQDAIVATMQYLARDVEFEGDPMSLAMTIARNRCRDLARWRQRRPQVEITAMADWLAAPEHSVLAEIEADQRLAMLRRCLGRLGEKCRNLLRALYLDQRSTEDVRQELGLGTVQGVYYRKAACLKTLRDLFNGDLVKRSRTRSNDATRHADGDTQ